jgi:DNA-binding transcriptional LysR family regulator
MDFQRLEFFLRIVDAGSLSAAAQVVHLTQPALSRNLKLLEEELDTELFERRGRGLVLTPAGRALVPRARWLLREAKEVARAVSRTAELGYFDVRIGTVDSVATYLFPPLVPTLRAAFPELDVKLTTARTAELLKRLREQTLDLAMVAWSGPPEGFPATRLGRYDLQYRGRADRFPELALAKTEAEVRRFPLVEIEPLPGQPTMIPDAAPSFAVANSLASVKALVLAGFGVGALLHFMLSPAEGTELAKADIPHDPDCALFLVRGPSWEGEEEARIEAQLAEAVRARLAEAAPAPALKGH